MGGIHEVLYAIVHLHMKSEPAGSIPPSMLDNIGEFLKTLHKIYMFIEAQQQGNKIKHLFCSNEINKLLHDCHAGLKQAQEVFCTQTQILSDIRDFTDKVKLMHRELMELIEKQSDASTLSERSSVYLGGNQSKNSSNSFSLLPSKPKIFHGREQELDYILKLISQCSPRITVLGGGGMGKTSLARAVLHHPDTCFKFEHRFFTVWEPMKSRAGIEEFLCLLTGVEHLALIITMRGAERPAKVQWSHPFLLPLKPLSNDAARKTFIEITDNSNTTEEVNQLLGFTDNMPLAVDLIAHLVDYEGFSNASINLSLSSPRITPGSKELLSLLSILPNGLSEAELVQSHLGIPKILSCKAALQATSLTYRDNNQRLMVLMPIREYFADFASFPVLYTTHLITGWDHSQLLDDVQSLLSHLCNHQLETILLMEFMQTRHYATRVSEDMIAQTIIYLDHAMDPILSAQYFFYYGNKGDAQRAIQSLHKAQEMSELCGDNGLQCIVLTRFGWFEWRACNYSAGIAYADRAYKLSANSMQEAFAHQLGAVCLREMGDYKQSAARFDKVTEILHICGMSGRTFDHKTTRDRAEIHLLKSEYTEARKNFCEVAKSTSAEQNSVSHAIALLNIALIDTVIQETGENVYHELNTVQKAPRDSPQGIVFSDIVQAILELREGKFNTAQIKFENCLQSIWGTSLCLEQLANIKAWPSDKWKDKWPTIYLVHAHRSKAKLDLHKALLFLGDVFNVNNEKDAATNLYQIALAGFTQMDVHHSRAQCMLRLGDLAIQYGRTSEAITLWKAARPLLERSVVKDVFQIESRLAKFERDSQEAHLKLDTLHAPIQLLKETSELEIKHSGKEAAEEHEHMVPVIM
ncbi:hypothetical protein K438DRAFT_1760443 [Mycena galopus ATCC 62051]|nr:hypothetical protein K438DRAFT_1760443 [Mycena galopus ATCC 62051]